MKDRKMGRFERSQRNFTNAYNLLFRFLCVYRRLGWCECLGLGAISGLRSFYIHRSFFLPIFPMQYAWFFLCVFTFYGEESMGGLLNTFTLIFSSLTSAFFVLGSAVEALWMDLGIRHGCFMRLSSSYVSVE